MKLSVLMITKNAGDVLADALKSIQGLYSELLVADDNSTDDTRMIVEQYGGKVFTLGEKNLGERKQWLVERARREWILILDSDERVSKELKEEIRKIVKSKSGSVGYRIPYQNYVFGKPVHWGGERYSKIRLFRRDYGSVTQAPLHEEVITRGKIGALHGAIHHHSFRTLIQLFTKFTKYAWIAASEKRRQREKITLAKVFVYGPHMFWARFIKEKGYKDGWRGFVLALAFAFMEQLTYGSLLFFRCFWMFLLISFLLGVHLVSLFLTNFIDWPEMLLYPWFLSKGLMYYRDVVLAYVPGAYYLLYGLYKILDFTPSALRIVAYIFIFVSDLLLFWVSLKLFMSRFISSLVLIFLILWQPIFTGNTIWYETILLPFYLLAFYSFYLFILRGKAKYFFLSSLVFGSALLIKQTAILPLIFSIAFLLLLKKNIKTFVQGLMMVILAMIPLLLFWAYYAVQEVGSEFFYWAFVFPSSLTRSDSYYLLTPSLADLALIGPAYLPVIFLAISSLFIWKKKKQVWPIILIIVWSVVLFFTGSPRWGMFRLVPSLTFSALALGYILFLAKNTIFMDGWSKFVFSIFLIMLVVGFARSFTKFVFVREKNAMQFWGDEYNNLGNFVEREIGDADFFVFGNYDYLYFFFDRKPSVLPWTPMFPWNGKVEGVQESIVASLEQTNVPYILYIPYHKNSRFYSDYYPKALGDYIFSKYAKVATLPVDGWLLKRINNE